MLFAILVCSDRRCDAAYEAWAEPHELEALECEECGRPLEAIAYSEAADGDRRRETAVRQRRAA